MKLIKLMTLAALTTTGASSFAASTGTLALQGIVPAFNDIVITPNGSNNTNINIQAGHISYNVATIEESSNNLAGYQIQMYSDNGGQLRHTVNPTTLSTYQVSYDGGSFVTPPTSASPLTVKNVASLSVYTSDYSDVVLAVNAFPGAPAGTYTDTLTFSIVAN